MYVSFSAGSVMAGLTVEINVDHIDPVLQAGGTRTKDGFKLVPYAVRPHNQGAASQAAGKDFERRLAAKQVKDDAGHVIVNCPVLYLKDGEACVFAGGTEPIMLPDKYAQDKIANHRSSVRVEEMYRSMPDYWEKLIATGSPDGFAAIALDLTGRDKKTCTALERLLQTDRVKLRRKGTAHDLLKLTCAWRLENPALWGKYMAGMHGVMRDMERIRQGGVTPTGGAPPLTRAAPYALPGQPRADVNEAFLMHGTNAGVLFNILATGMNERFAGTAAGADYGEGTYLAEDAGKTDRYTEVDPQYDGSSELHKRLYAHNVPHPGKVFYILVCRVALGHHVRTQQKGKDATSTDTGRRVFPISFRELDTVAGISPPVHHHSLLADVMDVGQKYREFIVFHSEYIYPEYLVAYQRYEGDRDLLA